MLLIPFFRFLLFSIKILLTFFSVVIYVLYVCIYEILQCLQHLSSFIVLKAEVILCHGRLKFLCCVIYWKLENFSPQSQSVFACAHWKGENLISNGSTTQMPWRTCRIINKKASINSITKLFYRRFRKDCKDKIFRALKSFAPCLNVMRIFISLSCLFSMSCHSSPCINSMTEKSGEGKF